MEGVIMERINRQRAPKGTVTVRTKCNSYEARVTLDLTSVMEGIEKNPRLSRTAKTEKEARRRLGEEIANILKFKNKLIMKKYFQMNVTENLINLRNLRKKNLRKKW